MIAGIAIAVALLLFGWLWCALAVGAMADEDAERLIELLREKAECIKCE